MFEDWSKHSIEQLVEKQDKLYTRLNYASHSGSSQLIDGLLRLIESIEMEIANRVAMARAIIENTPTIIETDPDLAAVHKKEVAQTEQEEIKPKLKTKPGTRRSAKPISPSDLN